MYEQKTFRLYIATFVLVLRLQTKAISTDIFNMIK
jgi:hypothetical protein